MDGLSEIRSLVGGASNGLSPSSMEIMEKVWMDARNRDLKVPSVRNALYEVARLLKWAQGRNRTFDQLTQDDMRQYYAEDNRGHNSKATSRVLLKSRLKRLGRKDLADAARYLSLKIDEKKIDVLTDEDVLAMMNATENMQWQLRLMTLWDTGARAGELCNARIKDVKFDQYGAIITLTGKTGTRRRRLFRSVKMMEAHIQTHPHKENPEAPLFFAEKGDRPLTVLALYQTVKKLGRRAAIKKRVWTHLFRHSVATNNASDYTDAELESLFGWRRGSNVVKRYRHAIDKKNLERKQLRDVGIFLPDDEKKNILAEKTCPRCGEVNPPLAKFCNRCNMALDQKTAQTLLQREERAGSVLSRVLEDQEVYSLLVRKIREMGLTSENLT